MSSEKTFPIAKNLTAIFLPIWHGLYLYLFFELHEIRLAATVSEQGIRKPPAVGLAVHLN